MTAAQKAAKANFKKAIEYRKKTGVSLKEAFAHVYGKKKIGAAPKKKAAKKAAPKKAAKKVGSVVKLKSNTKSIKALEDHIIRQKEFLKTDKNNLRLKNSIKLNESSLKTLKEGFAAKVKSKSKKVGEAPKKAAPKRSVSLHKDTKSHNVNIRVISGMESVAIGNVKYLFEQIRKAEGQYQILKDRKKRDKKLVGFDAKLFQRYPGYIRSLKKQLTEAKKNIK
jgi:hypothetical protein